MHLEEIKAALRMNGVTQAVLAEEMHVSRAHISMVIAGVTPSARVQNRIAEIIGKAVKKIWPHPQPVLRRSREQIAASRCGGEGSA